MAIGCIVKELAIDGTATLHPVDELQELKEINIEAPIGMLKPSSIALKDKRVGKKYTDTAYVSFGSQFLDHDFRKCYRELEIRSELKVLVRKTLSGNTFTGSYKFGRFNAEFDVHILNLGPLNQQSKTFCVSLKNQNHSLLDEALGKQWDVLTIDQIIRFVTSVEFKLSKQRDLSLHVSCSQLSGKLSMQKNYRTVLLDECRKQNAKL